MLPLATVSLVVAIALRAFAQAPSASTVADELHAAKLMEAALFARQRGGDAEQKLAKIYEDLDAKHPRSADVKNARAEFLWSIGERQHATDEWEAACRLEPANATVLGHLGDCQLATGDVKKSAAFYTRAVTAEPGNAAHHFALANVIFMFRHELHDATAPDEAAVLDRALSHFAQASRIEPLNLEYARAFAETYYNLPKPDWNAALAAWQHVLDISREKDFALMNMTRVHMHLGQKTEARDCLAKVHGPAFERMKTRLLERIANE
jgi:tetratricopeptide (TPR) repeat protein